MVICSLLYSLEGKKQSAGKSNQEHSEIEDACVRRRHQETITVKLVAAGENFPFARNTGTWRHCPAQQIHLGWWVIGGYCPVEQFVRGTAQVERTV